MLVKKACYMKNIQDTHQALSITVTFPAGGEEQKKLTHTEQTSGFWSSISKNTKTTE